MVTARLNRPNQRQSEVLASFINHKSKPSELTNVITTPIEPQHLTNPQLFTVANMSDFSPLFRVLRDNAYSELMGQNRNLIEENTNFREELDELRNVRNERDELRLRLAAHNDPAVEMEDDNNLLGELDELRNARNERNGLLRCIQIELEMYMVELDEDDDREEVGELRKRLKKWYRWLVGVVDIFILVSWMLFC